MQNPLSNKGSLAGSTKMETTRMEMFNFLWLISHLEQFRGDKPQNIDYLIFILVGPILVDMFKAM